MTTFWIGVAMLSAGLGVLVYRVTKRLLLPQAMGRRFNAGAAARPLVRVCHFCGVALCRLAPRWMEGRRERDVLFLEKAGLDDAMESMDVPGGVLAGGAAAGLAAVMLYGTGIAGTLGAACGGGLVAVWLLARQRRQRQDELVRQFPTAVDVICVGIGGGLDFGQAMMEVARNMEAGPVQREFERILREVSLGMARAAALRRFAARVDASEIRAFVTSLVQSIEVGGSGLRETLRVQSEQMRFNRLVRAEEAANKAPSKMVIPMILFIVPCIFLVVFVPLGMQVVETFRGMSGK